MIIYDKYIKVLQLKKHEYNLFYLNKVSIIEIKDLIVIKKT